MRLPAWQAGACGSGEHSAIKPAFLLPGLVCHLNQMPWRIHTLHCLQFQTEFRLRSIGEEWDVDTGSARGRDFEKVSNRSHSAPKAVTVCPLLWCWLLGK